MLGQEGTNEIHVASSSSLVVLATDEISVFCRISVFAFLERGSDTL